jgi:hypothetical protein
MIGSVPGSGSTLLRNCAHLSQLWPCATILSDPLNGRYRRHSGHSAGLALIALNDPEQTWRGRAWMSATGAISQHLRLPGHPVTQ